MKNFKPYHLHYIIGAKYNSIDESGDRVYVRRFEKKNYIKLFSYKDNVLIYNLLNGNLIQFDIENELQVILNYKNASDFCDFVDFKFDRDYYYFLDKESIVLKYDHAFSLQGKFQLPAGTDSFLFNEGLCYAYSRIDAVLNVFDLTEQKIINTISVPGIGKKGMFINGNDIWLTDDEENIVYVLNKDTWSLQYSVLTPFISPTGICIYKNRIFVSYDGFVSVNSFDNISWPEQKPFIHELRVELHNFKHGNYSLSNTFLVEFRYEETLKPEREALFSNLIVDLAIPLEDERQKLKKIIAIGVEFEVVKKNDKQFARFEIGNVNENSMLTFGYIAILELTGIKFTLNKELEYVPDSKNELPDDSQLNLNSRFIQRYSEINKTGQLVADIKQIRDKVYRSLYYRHNSGALNLEDVIRDGYGTCGDYTNLILACSILNNLPVRSVGGFKVPRFTNSQYESLSYQYNHVWLEFNAGDDIWLPFESSSDDKEYNERLSEGQFLGEDWSHIRTHFDTTVPNFVSCFDGEKEIHPYDILSNDINIKVLGEKF